jgi:protein arginine kinase
MVEALYGKIAPWITTAGPEGGIVLFTQGSLVRNLADFPFPSACSESERRLVEERLVNVLQMSNLMQSGHYRPSSELEPREAAFLAERRLIPFDFFKGRSHGGVYVSDDQSMSIVINGLNHLCITVNAAGENLREVWQRLDSLDDVFAGHVDFAFQKNLGYLTSALGQLGTGLKMSLMLNLPALAMSDTLPGVYTKLREDRQVLYGLKPMLSAGKAQGPAIGEGGAGEALYYDLTESLYAEYHEAQGDLYLLTNQATLGVSEEEIVFHLRQAAKDLVAREKEMRRNLLESERARIEDRVGRALGIARNARLMSYSEAVSILSSIRLGIDLGLVSGLTIPRMNELLFASQGAHIKMKKGHECDEWALSVERADLFRSRFGHDRKGL